MPYTDYISTLMDMESMNVEKVKQTSTCVTISFTLNRRPQNCPDCGTLTEAVHDYRIQSVKDCPVLGKNLVWEYRKRRFRCHCCGKRFYERNYLLPKWHRITSRLAALALTMLREKRSQSEIAASLNVSASTLGRWLQLIAHPKPTKLPAVLAIDEFKGNTDRGKYQCILTAPAQHATLDILPTYYSAHISEYLRTFPNRKEVKYFVMDMRKSYLDIAKSLFPNATVVIDRFHVSRYCVWAFENVRKKVQAKLLAQDRKYFKRSRKLLLTRMKRLSDENKFAVERMLRFSSELTEAYLLKESFFKFMDSANIAEAKKNLLALRLHAERADIPEFKSCLTMLLNWEPYILNAFDCNYSNAFTEGTNNTIKVIKRVAYGYRNFDNFRNRILLTVNNFG